MKIQQKKGWLLRDLIAGGVIMGLVITLFILAVAGMNSNYVNVNGINHDVVNPNFQAHYDKLNSNLELVNGANSAVQGNSGLNLVGAFDIAFNSVFTVFAMVGNSILIYTGMSQNIVGDFNFLEQAPVTIFIETMIALIVIGTIFVWLSSVTRGKI
jgi:hypothetical protein